MTYRKIPMPSVDSEWKQLNRWSELFDALCLKRNHISNTDLAYQFCKKQSRTSQKDMEATTRSISNWRTGANLPSRRNFRVLTELMEIAKDPELEAHWYAVYNKSNSAKLPQEHTSEQGRASCKSDVIFSLFGKDVSTSFFFNLVVFFSMAGGTAWFLDWYQDDMRLLAKNSIIWRKNVTMSVGEKIVVHGKKGICGKMPPPAEEIFAKLPKNLKTGRLTTGALGLRASNSCNGLTPAREIVFEAHTQGHETFFLFGNDINVQVASEPGKENYAVEQ